MAHNRSLYQEVYDGLNAHPGGTVLAERFSSEMRFDDSRPLPAQIHEINIYWTVILARCPVDSQDLRLCLEDTRGRQGRELTVFISNWLANFKREVIPFLVRNLNTVN